MMPLVSLGPLRLGTYGLFLMAGLLVWWTWSERRLLRQGVTLKDWHYIVVILAAWLGGRIGALVSGQVSADSFFVQLIQIRTLEYHGWSALAAAIVATLYVSRQSNTGFTQLVVTFGVPAIMVHALWSLGALVAGVGAGVPWQGPWAIDTLGAWRHPVQAYEALCLAIAGAWLWWRERQHRRVQIWHVVLAWSAMVLATAGFRAEVWLLEGGIVVAQVIALFLLALAVERVMMGTDSSPQSV